ncbi:MAG: dihydrofolate reductase family protein [Sedimentibacter saalensis]|uniref:dihydrofolate reductase family protein n=1 Tax=Sedimentibacter saalensis TaxID=130788 RepID=UPI002B20A863|nr:dihydrofolate reductase family protein [Sedimentibacter saalensis]MEA5096496.1 dihydrofolate reductase family protein [Sedimentibacter saalensis]
MEQRKLVLFIASTLDGYIATKDHNLDWLFNVEGEGDNGISEFYNTIDTIIMGRTTYDWIMAYEDVFPYKDKKCYIFSRTPKEDTEYVSFVNKDVASFTRELKCKSGKNIWIMGGSELISYFIKEKLIDEIIVTLAPVLLGSGIPLFRQNDFQTLLKLTSTNRFNQFVELHYEVIK